MLILEIDVASSFNQLVRDVREPIFGCSVERCLPIVCRNIYVAARSNELFRDGRFLGSDEERRGPAGRLKVDVKRAAMSCFVMACTPTKAV